MAEHERILELRNLLMNSPAMEHFNRSKVRQFSINILQLNARELFDIADHMADPEHGFQLMFDANKSAGDHAHREINRKIHNFVAAAKSLVDHTNVFIEKYYKDTSVEIEYKKFIKGNIASFPIVKFVQDLRNYMLHKGNPPSSRFLRITNNPENPNTPQTISVGVCFSAKTLLEWDSWSSFSKMYLDSAIDEEVHIKNFSREYIEKISSLHLWLDNVIHQFHAKDIEKYDNLRQELFELERKDEGVTNSEPCIVGHTKESSALSSLTIDLVGESLVRLIRQLAPISNGASSSWGERPVITLTDEHMIKPPQFWGQEIDGTRILGFIHDNKLSWGLSEEDYKTILDLADNIIDSGLPATRKCIEGIVIDWLRDAYFKQNLSGLGKAIFSGCLEKIDDVEVLFPITHLEVQEAFEFGPVEVVSLSNSKFDQLKSLCLGFAPNQHEDTEALFARMRDGMQGFAAIAISVRAESDLAIEKGKILAKDAIRLLRFFSPSAEHPLAICPVGLMGEEVEPASHVIVHSRQSFSYNSSIVDSVIPWRMSKEQLVKLKQGLLSQVGMLVETQGLSPFSLAVRTGIMLYGDGCVMSQQGNRLVYTLAALEAVLLPHSMEAPELNITRRVGLLLGTTPEEVERVSHEIRDAYNMRSKHGRVRVSEYKSNAYVLPVRYCPEFFALSLAASQCWFWRCPEEPARVLRAWP